MIQEVQKISDLYLADSVDPETGHKQVNKTLDDSVLDVATVILVCAAVTVINQQPIYIINNIVVSTCAFSHHSYTVRKVHTTGRRTKSDFSKNIFLVIIKYIGQNIPNILYIYKYMLLFVNNNEILKILNLLLFTYL